MSDIDTTISNLNSALLEESAWFEDLAGRIHKEILTAPYAWNDLRRSWPDLVFLVEEFIDQCKEDPADKDS